MNSISFHDTPVSRVSGNHPGKDRSGRHNGTRHYGIQRWLNGYAVFEPLKVNGMIVYIDAYRYINIPAF